MNEEPQWLDDSSDEDSDYKEYDLIEDLSKMQGAPSKQGDDGSRSMEVEAHSTSPRVQGGPSKPGDDGSRSIELEAHSISPRVQGGPSKPDDDGSRSMEVEAFSISRSSATVSLPEVRILAYLWNIQDLGGGPSQGPVRKEELKQTIASLIALANPDFVALLELKKTGAKLTVPPSPQRPQSTTSSAIERYLRKVWPGCDLAMCDAVQEIVPDFVYGLITALLWERIRPAANAASAAKEKFAEEEADEEEPEHESAEIILAPTLTFDDKKEALKNALTPLKSKQTINPEANKAEQRQQEQTKENQESVINALWSAACSRCAPDNADQAFLVGGTTPQWLENATGLAQHATKIANLGVILWAGIELGNSLRWPRIKIDSEKKLPQGSEAAAKYSKLVSSFKNSQTATNEGPTEYCKRQKDLLGELGNWIANFREHHRELADECQQVHDKVAQEIERFREHVSFLEEIAKTVFAEVLSAVVGKLSQGEELAVKKAGVKKPKEEDPYGKTYRPKKSTNKVTDLDLAKEFLAYCDRARMERYDALMAAYKIKKEEQDKRGTYPGLREFYEIVKRVDELAPKDDPYGVWPPRADLKALEGMEKNKEKETTYSKYFTNNEESYGILYKKSVFEAAQDSADGQQTQIPDIGPLDALDGAQNKFSKRAPFVVPLLVKRLNVIIRFLPWHAPAPSANNSEARAKDFKKFEDCARNYRANGQIAVLLSDTNVDTTADKIDRKVEHWEPKASAPTRSELIDRWTGEPGTLARLGVGTRPTSLVATKIKQEDGKEGKYRYHKAAYDKILIVSSTETRDGKPTAVLLQGRQQVVSTARAMQYDRTPKLERKASVLGMEEPTSPIVSVSRKLAGTLIAKVRQPRGEKDPTIKAEAFQLVQDARKVSDHDGVLSEMLLVEETEARGQARALLEKYRDAKGSQELFNVLDYLHTALFSPEHLGLLLDTVVFENCAQKFEVRPFPAFDPQTMLARWGELTRILGKAAQTNVDPSESIPTEALAKDVTDDPVDKELPEGSAEKLIATDHRRLVPNPGGGACLFYSVCELRCGYRPSFAAAHGLRMLALAHLQALTKKKGYASEELLDKLGKLFDWHKRTWTDEAIYGNCYDNYIKAMSKPNQGADLIMLLVMSHLFDCRFEVYVQLGKAAGTVVVDATNPNVEPESHCLFWRDAFHWAAVVPERRAELDVEQPVSSLPPSGKKESAPTATTGPSATFNPSFDWKKNFVVRWHATESNGYNWDLTNIKNWNLEDWLFVFGDNGDRTGVEGQASIRSLKNAIGLRTCKKPATLVDQEVRKRLSGLSVDKRKASGMTFPFCDSELANNKNWIGEDIEAIKRKVKSYKRIVIPYNPGADPVSGHQGYWNLGTGLAAMPLFAPESFKYLQKAVSDLVKDLEKIPAPSLSALSPSGGMGGSPGGMDEEEKDAKDGDAPGFPRDDRGGGGQGPGKNHPSKRVLYVQLVSLLRIEGSEGFKHPEVTVARPRSPNSFELPVSLFPPLGTAIGESLSERIEPSEAKERSKSMREAFDTEKERLQEAIDSELYDELWLTAPQWGELFINLNAGYEGSLPNLSEYIEDPVICEQVKELLESALKKRRRRRILEDAMTRPPGVNGKRPPEMVQVDDEDEDDLTTFREGGKHLKVEIPGENQ